MTAALLVGAAPAARAQDEVPNEPIPPPGPRPTIALPLPLPLPPPQNNAPQNNAAQNNLPQNNAPQNNPPAYNPPPYTPPPPPPPSVYVPPPYGAAYPPARSPAYAPGYPAYTVEHVPSEHVRFPVEVTVSGGYAFSSGVPVAGGLLALAPSPAFGASLNLGDWYGARFELGYLLQDTAIQLEPNSGANQLQYNLMVHHFRIGGEFDILRSRVRPFLGISVGAEWLAPESDLPDELWFEATIEAGVKVRLTKMIGLRAQAAVTSVSMDARSQVFCANGCYSEWYGIGTSQLELMLGPMLKF